MIYFGECDCDCHQQIGTVHAFPCCSPCRFCGRNMKLGFIEEHESEHKERDHVDDWGDLSEDWIPPTGFLEDD